MSIPTILARTASYVACVTLVALATNTCIETVQDRITERRQRLIDLKQAKLRALNAPEASPAERRENIKVVHTTGGAATPAQAAGVLATLGGVFAIAAL